MIVVLLLLLLMQGHSYLNLHLFLTFEMCAESNEEQEDYIHQIQLLSATPVYGSLKLPT